MKANGIRMSFYIHWSENIVWRVLIEYQVSWTEDRGWRVINSFVTLNPTDQKIHTNKNIIMIIRP